MKGLWEFKGAVNFLLEVNGRGENTFYICILSLFHIVYSFFVYTCPVTCQRDESSSSDTPMKVKSSSSKGKAVEKYSW